eukprot:scaffold95438_cov20-Prasinocladus_malaysianus.AAC.1
MQSGLPTKLVKGAELAVEKPGRVFTRLTVVLIFFMGADLICSAVMLGGVHIEAEAEALDRMFTWAVPTFDQTSYSRLFCPQDITSLDLTTSDPTLSNMRAERAALHSSQRCSMRQRQSAKFVASQ